MLRVLNPCSGGCIAEMRLSLQTSTHAVLLEIMGRQEGVQGSREDVTPTSVPVCRHVLTASHSVNTNVKVDGHDQIAGTINMLRTNMAHSIAMANSHPMYHPLGLREVVLVLLDQSWFRASYVV